MSFYNPYMKNPDWSQGIGDIASQIQMMLMLKKLMPQQGKFGGAGAVGASAPQAGGSIGGAMGQPPPMPMPQNRMGGGMGAGVMGQAPPQMNDQPYSQGGGQNPLSNMDPKMLMMIMQMIQQMKGGQTGGGMPGGGMMGGGGQFG